MNDLMQEGIQVRLTMKEASDLLRANRVERGHEDARDSLDIAVGLGFASLKPLVDVYGPFEARGIRKAREEGVVINQGTNGLSVHEVVIVGYTTTE